MGQTRYLYLTTMRDDALWFAEQKGCNTVVELKNVPIEFLKVDPEDGFGDSIEDELFNSMGLPGKVVLTRSLPASNFSISE